VGHVALYDLAARAHGNLAISNSTKAKIASVPAEHLEIENESLHSQVVSFELDLLGSRSGA
jgi:hypothetical protein